MRSDALRVTREGQPLLVLRIILGSQNIPALVLDGNTVRFESMKVDTLLSFPVSPNRRQVLDLFHRLALQAGYLFYPGHVLTYREQTDEGPPRCYFDHTELSLEKHSLGCTQCRYYVCQYGRCLCGNTGMKGFSLYEELAI